jgi:hypothetical protein
MRMLNLKNLTPICALLLSAGFAAWSQTPPPRPQPAPPAPAFSKELRGQLQALRDAALTSDCA